ncbi:MAG: hypothetical protein [Wendovervirus sonii]|uniref:Uncharacterized protein n=1 Tax=phage Lak_Megaphage_Sonny TaxID=3109229 RepID=A0ABZ0Z3E8_9CAUD|nr:MAG: hypothetical protein [phage Lak_Megaphage_Sonny]
MTIANFKEQLSKKYGYSLLNALEPNDTVTHVIYDEYKRFFASVYYKNSKVVFNGKSYKDVDILKSDIDEFNKTLKYPLPYYNPILAPTAKVGMAINEYLIKSGFKTSSKNYEMTYVLTDIFKQNIIELDYNMSKNDDESGTIYYYLPHGGCIHSDFNGIDEAISTINSLIETKCLTDIANEISILDKISDNRKYDSIKYFDLNALKNMSLKEYIKEKLQHAIEML